MADEVKRTLKVLDTPEEVSEAAAGQAAASILAAVAARGRCALVLAGGQTPMGTYALLARRYGQTIPWPSVHLFWGDERCVPPDDPRSNFKMAQEALLGQVPIPPKNIHRILGERPPALAAEEYERGLRAFFRPGASVPAFDLVFLGVGADGHTASLFPGAPALEESRRWVMAVEAPDGVPCRHRVTLTLPAINASRAVFFLVTGAEKNAVVRDLRGDPVVLSATPAGRVRPHGELLLFVDKAAEGASPRDTHE
jgi:6-phosphogluconolactonase